MNPPAVPPSKVQAPRPGERSARRHALMRRLDDAAAGDAAAGDVVLLSAPAGFGKTTALAQWVHSLPPGWASGWLTLDGADGVARFVEGLCAALDAHDLPWQTAPEAMAGLARPPGGVEPLAEVLCQGLAAAGAERGVLVLDDVDRVEDTRLLRLLELLLRGLPRRWTVALAARVDPPLPLPRLRAEGRLVEIRADDLRLSPEELAGPSGPDAERIARLIAATEGWPAGLDLLARAGPAAMPAGAVGTTREHLYDYLASEVLDELPPALRRFALWCSVLPELTPARCTALLGDPSAATWLQEIARRGLFVTALDGDGSTWRFHELFRRFLEDRLVRESPEARPALLRRAAADEPDLARRVDLLLQAGLPDAAEAEIEASARAGAEDPAPLLALFDRLPDDRGSIAPGAAMLRGLSAWAGLEYHTVWRETQAAASGFAQRGRHADASRAQALGRIAQFMLGRPPDGPDMSDAPAAEASSLEDDVLRQVLGYLRTLVAGPADAPGRHLDRLTDRLQDGAAHPTLWFHCAAPLFYFANRPGHAAALDRFLAGALAAAGDRHLPLLALAETLQAGACLVHGDLPGAEALIAQAQDDFAWLAQPPVSRRLPVIQAARHVLRGDVAAAREACAGWIGRARTSREPRNVLLRQSVNMAGRLASAAGAWDLVDDALDFLGDGTRFAEGPPARQPVTPLLARRLLHEGRAQEARELLRDGLDDLTRLDDTDRLGLSGFARTVLAVAALETGDARAAWEALAPLLARIAITGEVGSLLLAGPVLLEALGRAEWGDEADPALRARLAEWLERGRRWRQVPAGAAAPTAGNGGDPLPPGGLSAREWQVLDCLAAGDSNKLIARRLALSPHTVKRHVARILRRLALSSRHDAARWYAAQPYRPAGLPPR